MRISTIILLTFFSILILFSISTYLSGRQHEVSRGEEQRLEQSATILKLGNRFQRNFLIMVSGVRGYLITRDSSFLGTYDSALIDNQAIIDELFKLVPAASQQRIVLDDITALQAYWVD